VHFVGLFCINNLYMHFIFGFWSHVFLNASEYFVRPKYVTYIEESNKALLWLTAVCTSIFGVIYHNGVSSTKIALLILNFENRCRWSESHPCQFKLPKWSCTHYIEGWMGTRARLNAPLRNKSSFLRRESKNDSSNVQSVRVVSLPTELSRLVLTM
jgi:hypothetical protein